MSKKRRLLHGRSSDGQESHRKSPPPGWPQEYRDRCPGAMLLARLELLEAAIREMRRVVMEVVVQEINSPVSPPENRSP